MSVQEQTHAQRGRLYAVLGGLYLAQGIPTYLLIVALPPLMRDAGASRTAIGLFSLLMLPLVLKFLAAPFVDRISPLARLGHRRGWVIPTQLLVSALIASMAFFDPSRAGPLFAVGLAITVLSSLQDIATDGYAVRHLDGATRAVGNAIQAGAVALGVVLGGTMALVLFGRIGWTMTILIVAALSLLPLAAAVWMRETREHQQVLRGKPAATLRAFFMRPNAWIILGFALTYRASEGLVRGMEGPFLVDIGLPVEWIGYLSGGTAATAGLVGAVISAFLIRKAGLKAALVTLGVLRTVCFLVFTLCAAHVFPGPIVAMSASAFQSLIRYMELVAIYSLFMKSSSNEQPGTDFTILTCAELIVYLVGASIAGFLADRLGYAILFGIATFVSFAGIGLAYRQLAKLDQRELPVRQGEKA
ncbi:RhtX/FptX family siderophore transporter (plasmid) [Shinella sumterensis]|nr:RhtX/FptX family siderophore transporter [Shinella sumterensis]